MQFAKRSFTWCLTYANDLLLQLKKCVCPCQESKPQLGTSSARDTDPDGSSQHRFSRMHSFSFITGSSCYSLFLNKDIPGVAFSHQMIHLKPLGTQHLWDLCSSTVSDWNQPRTLTNHSSLGDKNCRHSSNLITLFFRRRLRPKLPRPGPGHMCWLRFTIRWTLSTYFTFTEGLEDKSLPALSQSPNKNQSNSQSIFSVFKVQGLQQQPGSLLQRFLQLSHLLDLNCHHQGSGN